MAKERVCVIFALVIDVLLKSCSLCLYSNSQQSLFGKVDHL